MPARNRSGLVTKIVSTSWVCRRGARSCTAAPPSRPHQSVLDGYVGKTFQQFLIVGHHFSCIPDDTLAFSFCFLRERHTPRHPRGAAHWPPSGQTQYLLPGENRFFSQPLSSVPVPARRKPDPAQTPSSPTAVDGPLLSQHGFQLMIHHDFYAGPRENWQPPQGMIMNSCRSTVLSTWRRSFKIFYHGIGQMDGVKPAQIRVQQDTAKSGSRPGAGHGDTEDGVGSQPAFCWTFLAQHFPVDGALLCHQQSRSASRWAVYIGHLPAARLFPDTADRRCPAAPLMDTGRSTGGNRCPAKGTETCALPHLYRRVSRESRISRAWIHFQFCT